MANGRDTREHFVSEEDDGKKCWHEKTEQEKLADIEKKFIHDDGAQSNYTPELKHLLGEEFKGYKGQDAVDKLLKEKRGHVKGAFHRDDIGDIDLFWGNDHLGLQHIIKRREEQGINIHQFLSNIEEVVEEGSFLKKGNNGTFEFWNKGKSVIISPQYQGNKITYILTAFRKTLNKNRVPK